MLFDQILSKFSQQWYRDDKHIYPVLLEIVMFLNHAPQGAKHHKSKDAVQEFNILSPHKYFISLSSEEELSFLH